MLTDVEWQALMLSLKVALTAMAFGLPFSIALAWVLARRDFPGKSLVNVLVHAPLVLPPVVVGYLLLLAFAPGSSLGKFLRESLGLPLAFAWQGAALAALVMAMPMMVRSVRLAMEVQNPRYEQAARTLGAGRAKTLFTVTLPLAWPGIISGMIMGFARALGEFGATITFVSNIPGLTQTLPLALYTEVQTPGGEPAAIRLMIISLVLAFGALLFSELLARRYRRKVEPTV